MAPYDMGKLIYALQQDKLFNSKVTKPMLHELEQKSIQKNIVMVSM